MRFDFLWKCVRICSVTRMWAWRYIQAIRFQKCAELCVEKKCNTIGTRNSRDILQFFANLNVFASFGTFLECFGPWIWFWKRPEETGTVGDRYLDARLDSAVAGAALDVVWCCSWYFPCFHSVFVVVVAGATAEAASAAAPAESSSSSTTTTSIWIRLRRNTFWFRASLQPRHPLMDSWWLFY